MTNCTYCGTEVSDLEAVVCPQCGVDLERVPWEHPTLGVWPIRWWRTCLMAMRTPLALFRRLRPVGGLRSAMTFFVICAVVQAVIGPIITGQLAGGVAQRFLASHLAAGSANMDLGGDALGLWARLPGRPPSATAQPKRLLPDLSSDVPNVLTALSVVGAGFGFVLAFGSLFSLAATFQLGAMLFVPDRRPFADTLRVTAYAYAPAVCAIVPILGQVVFAAWMSYLWFVGLREIHHTTNGRVILAMTVIPLATALVLAVGCIALVAQLGSTLRL